jgi:hypothetical protein
MHNATEYERPRRPKSQNLVFTTAQKSFALLLRDSWSAAIAIGLPCPVVQTDSGLGWATHETATQYTVLALLI